MTYNSIEHWLPPRVAPKPIPMLSEASRVNAVGETETTTLVVARTSEEAKRKALELNTHQSRESAIAAAAAGHGLIWTVTLRVEFIDAHTIGARAS